MKDRQQDPKREEGREPDSGSEEVRVKSERRRVCQVAVVDLHAARAGAIDKAF